MMPKILNYVLSTLVWAVMLCSFPVVGYTQQSQNYLIATGGTGGTYYPVGVALATLTKVKLWPDKQIGMSALTSGGSEENIQLLKEDEAQFAILQSLYGYYASENQVQAEAGNSDIQLRAVTMLWPNVEQFVINSDFAKTGTLDDLLDLKGKKMAFGEKDSGSISSSRTLLKGLGIDIENDYELYYANYGDSSEALQNDLIYGMNTAAGVPTGAVFKAFYNLDDKITLLEVTEEQINKLDGGKGLWTRFVIESGTYPNLNEDINTIAQANFLAVRADVPEESVYQITKTIYENLPFLQAIHEATNAMNLDTALNGLPQPLHPGAIRFYKEAGINIPEYLIEWEH